MKLQFNLLPDVKQEYLKTRRTKRTIITASVVASAISLFIFMIMLTTVYIVNKKQLNDADKDIKKYSSQLQGIKNLDKILTVQNQLSSLKDLHSSKHKMSRIYTFLPRLTPANVCLSSVSVDTTTSKIQISGDADSQKTINTFVDTLKFTKYSADGADSGKFAFPSVVESQFSIQQSSKNDSGALRCNGNVASAKFGVDLLFDAALFSNAQEISLKVPQGLVTTRSVLSDPSSLFNGELPVNQPATTTTGGAQ
jgi:Tfp pilus assembly protein PilN